MQFTNRVIAIAATALLSTAASAGLPSNALPANGIASNGLPANGGASNGLPANGLPGNGIAVASEGLAATLTKTGKFKTFVALLKVAAWNGDGKAGILVDDGSRGLTILAPNDAAFAAMDKARLAALMNSRAAARAFIRAHVLSQPLKVTDLFYADNPTSEKFFRSATGGELKLLCNGRAHIGLHHPRINDGVARVGDVQDVPFDGGMIQEIDGILTK
jgi:uncharacterized surface protein with fasciclin (FAS1) repeats